jgi:hypothetical protein
MLCIVVITMRYDYRAKGRGHKIIIKICTATILLLIVTIGVAAFSRWTLDNISK